MMNTKIDKFVVGPNDAIFGSAQSQRVNEVIELADKFRASVREIELDMKAEIDRSKAKAAARYALLVSETEKKVEALN